MIFVEFTAASTGWKVAFVPDAIGYVQEMDSGTAIYIGAEGRIVVKETYADVIKKLDEEA